MPENKTMWPQMRPNFRPGPPTIQRPAYPGTQPPAAGLGGLTREERQEAKRLAEELYKARDYETLEVEHPEGEYSIGRDGYVEFHMREGAAVEWVLEHMYTRE